MAATNINRAKYVPLISVSTKKCVLLFKNKLKNDIDASLFVQYPPPLFFKIESHSQFVSVTNATFCYYLIHKVL